MQSRHTKAEEFPAKVEELLGFVLRHVASELRADECPAPLAESLRVYTRAVMAATRDEHEHATPVVHVRDEDVAVTNGQPTLPTEPPVSYEDRPQRRRSLTARGGWRVE